MSELNFSNDWVDKTKQTISITALLNMMEEPFNQDAVAERTFSKHYNDEKSEYYHMTVDEIKNEWSRRGQESIKYGKLSDDYIKYVLSNDELEIEMWKLDNNFDNDIRLQNNCSSFDNFWSVFGNKYDFVNREQEVYYLIPNTNYYIKGRYDSLFKNKETGRYLVIDWKTSGTIDKERKPWTNSLKGPLNIFPDLNWYTYTTQVYFYKTALVKSKYLSENITLDDVDVAIVDLPGKQLKSGYNWEYNLPAYQYNETLMSNLFNYAVKRTELQKKIDEKKNNK